jgi:hypothetical protein
MFSGNNRKSLITIMILFNSKLLFLDSLISNGLEFSLFVLEPLGLSLSHYLRTMLLIQKKVSMLCLSMIGAV